MRESIEVFYDAHNGEWRFPNLAQSFNVTMYPFDPSNAKWEQFENELE
jgi:hypothetical protein